MTEPVDPMCHELARHFLDNVKFADEMDVQELAEAIQKLCEEYCRPQDEEELDN
jgi:hypothetical protein